MASRKHVRKQTLPAQPENVEPDDGMHRASNRKALQLCRQVERTLNSVLQSESGDDCLRDLLVEAVVPFPNAARLLVTVAPGPVARDCAPADILEHLHRAKGLLRSEIAAAISRRKVPELIFRLHLASGSA